MIDKAKYKDISFYSGFAYLREVATGYAQTTTDAYGYQVFNSTIPLPAAAVQRPPYIQYYLEFPSGTFSTLGFADGCSAGLDGNNMKFNGYINADGPGTTVGRIHYHIYDRVAL